MDIKQVIVMRTDLNMRKGKMIAQGAHASMIFMTNKLKDLDNPDNHKRTVVLSEVEKSWIDGSFKKICVSVGSEEELLHIYELALNKGLAAHKVIDSGLTEFKCQPTLTCVAIGPDFADLIDSVTGELKLL